MPASLIRTRALLSVGLLAITPAVVAQTSYPVKPVRMVVPFAPGGGVDVTARILAQQLTQRVGQSFLVENRTGASGIIGVEYVAKSARDGYTLLVGSQTRPLYDPPSSIRPPCAPPGVRSPTGTNWGPSSAPLRATSSLISEQW